MKALLRKSHATTDPLALEDIPSPTPGPGEVRLRMHACGMSFPDLLLLSKGCSLAGVLCGRFSDVNPVKSTKNFATLFAMHARGERNPNISHRFALADSAVALHALENREVVGKCVITMG